MSEPDSIDVSAAELKAMLDSANPPVVVDVREPNETARGTIAAARLIPLGTLETRCGEIPKQGVVVINCQKGGRSMQAVRWLRQRGYDNVRNLGGGFDAWKLL